MSEQEITSGVSAESLPATPAGATGVLKETPAQISTAIGEINAVLTSENAQTKAKDTKVRKKRKRRRKRVRIGDALRCEGLDEREVAQKLRSVIEKETPDTTDKMRAEILMNCFRYLDDAPGPRPGAKLCGKLPAKLVHEIPRPQRAAKAKDSKQKGTER